MNKYIGLPMAVGSLKNNFKTFADIFGLENHSWIFKKLNKKYLKDNE